MKRTRITWLGALLVVLLAACGAPQAPTEVALLTDADLDAAETLQAAATTIDLAAAPLEQLSAPALSAQDRSGAPMTTRGQLEATRGNAGLARGHDDLGGWLAYVEQKGATYAIRLVDLDDDNNAHRRGDYTVYSGKRHIQSVAVSRDGGALAFVAESKDGDYDLYLLDVQRGKVSSTRTPDADERDVSMSLDGRALVWQGGTPDAPSLVWYHDDAGGYLELSTDVWRTITGLPLVSAQPSVGGDGFTVAFIDQGGAFASHFGYGPFPGLATLELSLMGGGLSLEGLTLHYRGVELLDPSLAYGGSKIMFQEIWNGTPFLSLIDVEQGVFVDLIGGVRLDHPFITADGAYATFSAFGDAYVLDLASGGLNTLSPDAKTTDSATYWARGNYTAYHGSNDQGTFVRPEDGALDAAGRTVGYHVYEFRPFTSDYYAIDSVQDYDGYLNLYVDRFDPSRPERNLVASNDDYLHSWSTATGGRSRIVAQLASNKKYYVVTSACGAPGTPCGPEQGSFRNVISDGATPPAPPTQLPEPDNSGFNITLRFWNDSLTDAEKEVFTAAADRWSEAIVGDLEDIPGLVLTEADVTPGAPGIVGDLDDVIIDAAKVAIDGPGGVLARAGAYYVRTGGPDHFLPIYGIMEFDEAEFGPGGFFEDLEGFKETIMHEMGHVLGISRVFFREHGFIEGAPANTSVCSDVAKREDPRYTGPAGAEAWHVFYGADSVTVPLANTGGCGTADSHWREIYLQDELMTGYAQGGGEPLSRVTIGALQDLGYVVDFDAADDWSVPALPSLRRVSPDAFDYAIEFDFASAYTNSKLGKVTAAITPVDLNLGSAANTSGCEMDDFASFPAGNIALLRRGECAFGVKAANALAAGASAVIIGNQGDGDDRMAPTTGTFGDYVDIVGVPVSYDVMVELAAMAEAGAVVVYIDTDPNGTTTLLGPQALPRIQWHLAEELIPLRGGIDRDGNITTFDD